MQIFNISRIKKGLLVTLLSFLFVCVNFIPALSEVTNIPHPNDFLGIELGADRVLADYSMVESYYKMVAENSDRMIMQEVGTSGHGWHTLSIMIISSPENLARMEEIKKNQALISDPRLLSEEELEIILEDQPMVMYVNPAMHASEIAINQLLPIFVYDYVTTEDPEWLEYLDNVVLVMSPTHNPDGLDIETHWYWEQLGTPYEGSSPPELYCKYSGHDNNRDLFMANLSESKAWNKVLYHEWYPIFVWDVHQMGSTGARYFIPPYFDPHNPEIHPSVISDIALFGTNALSRMNAKGLTGIVTNAMYDMWWHGGFRLVPYYHNMIGILTEAASAARATPVEVPWDEIGGKTRGLTTAKEVFLNFANPWPGGTWRMSDIFPYEYETMLGFLDTCASHKKDLQRRYYIRNKEAVEKGISEPPYAFVIPADKQNDLGTVKWMLDILLLQHMEIHQALTPFTVGRKTYPANSIVIFAAQPTRPNVMGLLSFQNYPPRFEYPGGPPERPYDVAAWSLPMNMGVTVEKINEPLSVDSIAVIQVKSTDVGQMAKFFQGDILGSTTPDYGYIFGAERNDVATVRNRLIDAGYTIYNTSEEFEFYDNVFTASSTVIPNTKGLDAFVNELAKDVGMTFYGLDHKPEVELKKINKPRVALYTSWNANMDTGWLRFILENYEFDFVRLRDSVVRKGNLNDQFDIIIFGDEAFRSIKNGRAAGSVPEQYTGGIGDEGVANLGEFARNGGTLLLIDDASGLAIEGFGVNVRNVTADVPTVELWCPGSFLNIELDASHPVVHGYPSETYAYFKSSPTYEVTGEGPVIFGRWPEDSEKILAAGWLEGPDKIAGKAALVDVPIGEGRAILTGFMTNHRGHTQETFKIILNSIYLSVL